tara:strand:- start:3813 stop:5882 length:2070 start_codon:yes stop_codon:yes gene_type:complete
MALIYNPADLRLLRPGAKINPPKGTYIYDIHPRIHNLDDLMTKIYEELAALDAAIGTSSAQIAINTANIASNLVLINTNISNISALSVEVAGINTQVVTNTADISSLVTITTNNTTDIANNTTNISANTTQIAANTTQIAANFGDITALTVSVMSNTTNIATNTTDIAANAAAIAALYQIIRVTSQAEFEAAAATLAATGGAIVIDGTFFILSDFNINLTDIQVWGMNGGITFYNNSTNAHTKMTITGNNFFFREVRFGGYADFRDNGFGVPNSGPYSGWGTSYTKTIIEINGGSMGRGQFVDCVWYDCIAKENGDVNDEPIVMVTNASNWCTLKLERNSVATRHSSGSSKPYGGFRLGRADGYQGWRVIFYDWSLSGSAGTIGGSAYQNVWADSFSNATRFFITEATSGTIQREFQTDGTIEFDYSRSTVGGSAMTSATEWNVFQPKNQAYHFTGTATPTSSNTYGKPGDTYRDTSSERLYLKKTTLRKDTNWTELLTDTSPTITTIESDITTNTTNITNNTTDIATNTGDISTNASDISFNATSISTNSTNIANIENINTLTLNPIQVNTINSTPITLVAAPLITQIIVPIMAICELDYSGGTITSADESFELIVETATAPCLILDSVITQNGDVKVVSSASSAPSLGETVLIPGRPLEVTAGSNPTLLGGSTSSWKITIWYKLVTV